MVIYNSLSNLKANLGFKISITSPLTIIKWSWRKINGIVIFGQLSEPYTIDLKFGVPKLYGLFCEKIFGPLLSWQCKCGVFNKIKPIKYNFLCPLCGFENNTNIIRRYRMGYIYLYTPISHIWYVHNLLPYILNYTVHFLDYLLFYKFIKDNNTLYLKKITTSQLLFASNYIQFLLKKINLFNELLKKKNILNNKNSIKIKHITKHINLINLCILNNIQPYWIMLDLLPVLPAGLRPIVKINNNYVISPLNEIYKNIIIKNNRLRRYQTLRRKFPIFFEILEKRNLQNNINILIQSNINPFSLSSNFQGKYNYFRQYILGKRINFSGRSVITPGASLCFNKIGVSILLSLNLYKYTLYYFLKNNKNINTLLRASIFVEYSPLILKRLLKFIFNKEVIILNRAPTLHRMNIQTFKPCLVEHEILELFPLSCSGFNADFDGDQMGIFLIISKESKKEAKKNLIFDKNLLSPSKKKNIFKYSQNIILGLNVLLMFKGSMIKNIIFNNIEDIFSAYNHSLIKLNDVIIIKLNFHINSFFKKKTYILTSLGRLLLYKLD